MTVYPPQQRILTRMVLANLRVLKKLNEGDSYYENYLDHYKRDERKFFDQYHYAIDTVIHRSPNSILEVGVRTGLSICNMLNAYVDYSKIKRVVLCDIWADGYASPEIVKMNLKAINIPQKLIDKIEFVKADSQKYLDVLKAEGAMFDYILIDGDHTPEVALKDLEKAVPLCDKGGVIVFDDISEHGCGLRGTWEEFKQMFHGIFEFGEDLNGKGTGWGVKNG